MTKQKRQPLNRRLQIAKSEFINEIMMQRCCTRAQADKILKDQLKFNPSLLNRRAEEIF